MRSEVRKRKPNTESQIFFQRPDLTQSISILSYDLIQRWAKTLEKSEIVGESSLIFSKIFFRPARAGPYRFVRPCSKKQMYILWKRESLDIARKFYNSTIYTGYLLFDVSFTLSACCLTLFKVAGRNFSHHGTSNTPTGFSLQ